MNINTNGGSGEWGIKNGADSTGTDLVKVTNSGQMYIRDGIHAGTNSANILRRGDGARVGAAVGSNDTFRMKFGAAVKSTDAAGTLGNYIDQYQDFLIFEKINGNDVTTNIDGGFIFSFSGNDGLEQSMAVMKAGQGTTMLGTDLYAYGKYGNNQYPVLAIKCRSQQSLSQCSTCVTVHNTADIGGGMVLIDNDTSANWGIEYANGWLAFSYQNANASNVSNVRCYLKNEEEGQLVFTGQHKNVPETGVADDYTQHVGKIVISTGTYHNLNSNVKKDEPSINESLPKIALSSQTNDKRVWGVVSNAEDSSTSIRTENHGAFHTIYNKEDNRVWVNSVGEGSILVSNYNGNLENGDYITTSPIEGIGMKQDDDLLHNYTVAKITQDIDFTSGCKAVVYNGQTYQQKLVGCTYHCG